MHPVDWPSFKLRGEEHGARCGQVKTKTVRAVDRAIDILQCFSADKPAMSVIEIQRRVPLSRPTLYRLLQTLAARHASEHLLFLQF